MNRICLIVVIVVMIFMTAGCGRIPEVISPKQEPQMVQEAPSRPQSVLDHIVVYLDYYPKGKKGQEWLKIGGPLWKLDAVLVTSVVIHNKGKEPLENLRVRMTVKPEADWWWGIPCSGTTPAWVAKERVEKFYPELITKFHQITSERGISVPLLVPGDTLVCARIMVVICDPKKVPHRCSLQITGEILASDEKMNVGIRKVEIVNIER